MAVVAAAPVFGLLGYVESSTGMCDSLWEGGRTEFEFADINNDGNTDILSIGDHGSPFINTRAHGVTVLFGNGHGVWDTFQFGNFGYGGIAIGDVNWDGNWDVGYGMHHNYSGVDLGDQLIEVALGDGTGRMWTAWDDSLAMEGQNWGMFSTDFADIDNDGDLDVGSVSFGSGDGIWVYLNLGNGAWRRCFGYSGGNSQMEFYLRDINRDGNADIIAAHGTGTVWFGDGAGGFTPANNGLPQSSYGLAGLSAGDADGDGGCDLALVNSVGGVEVWRWDDGGRVWTSFSGGLPQADSFSATQLCDMDADGFTDLCALRRGAVVVWTGDGAGNWVEATRFAVPRPSGYSAFRTGADFDHNGRPDLAMSTREGSWPSDRNRAHAFRETTAARTLGVFPVFPRGGEKFLNGSVQFVDWWSEAPGAESTRVRLELSTTGSGGPWVLVADSLRNAGRYQWRVPDGVVSGDCRLRYSVSGPGGTAQVVTPRAFVIGDTTVSIREGGRRQLPSLSVEPNPSNGLVRVSFGEQPMGGLRLAVLDVAGRAVGHFNASGSLALDLRQLPPGTYFLRVDVEGSLILRKLVLHGPRSDRH